MNQPLPPVPAGSDGTAEVVLREERLRVGHERVPVERVRISRRVVTETRTVEMQVRREELHVERFPLTGGVAGAGADAGPASGPREVRLVLSEEVPVVTTQVRPVEHVRIWVDEVVEQQAVTAELRHEDVDVDVAGTARRP